MPQEPLTKILGITWAHVCFAVMVVSGLALSAELGDNASKTTPLAIVFGTSLISLSILEARKR